MKHCCETCEYWIHEDIDDGHVCCNGASDNCADWTDASDCCFEYEAKEKLTKDEIAKLMRECTTEMNRLIQKLEECGAD